VTGYLDASVLVPLFCLDALNARAEAAISAHAAEVVLSDFAVLEMSSALARKVRTGDLTPQEASAAFAAIDAFARNLDAAIETTAADLATATALVRRLDLRLRGPDALHIAIAQRLGATLFTFDQRMAEAATVLGVAVAS